MQLTDTVATLGVGTGEERILLRLTERTLTAEVMPEYWERIEAGLLSEFDDGSLMGELMMAGTRKVARGLKRWYLGPHDIATIDMAFDGHVLRVQRHGLGDIYGRDKLVEDGWYTAFDVVGGAWSDGFEPEEAEAFVARFRELRDARLSALGYAAGVGARVLLGAAAAGVLVFAVAWTIRKPKKG